MWGWAFATRSSPIADIWRSSPFEGSGCRLPDANRHCKRRLRPLSRTGHAVAHAACWVRLLRRPAGRSHTPNSTTTEDPAWNALQHPPLYPGSAPAVGGTLAQGYGSCLLPLRLLSIFQSGDPVFRPPAAGGFVRPCRTGPTPRDALLLCASPVASRSLPAGASRQRARHVSVPSSNQNPQGHWV